MQCYEYKRVLSNLCDIFIKLFGFSSLARGTETRYTMNGTLPTLTMLLRHRHIFPFYRALTHTATKILALRAFSQKHKVLQMIRFFWIASLTLAMTLHKPAPAKTEN
jgi:hypothetical protein